MKVTVKKDKIIRKTEEVEIDLPDETSYYFITGERQSYKLVPKFADWDDGRLYEYEAVRVGLSFECIIEKFRLTPDNIVKIYNGDYKNPYYDLVKAVVNRYKEAVRTKERFEEDLNRAIDIIKSV